MEAKVSERIRYAWGTSSLGDSFVAASDDSLVAFEFGEQGTAMLDTLQMRFPDAAIVDDRSGLSDIVGKLEHLVEHPDQDPGIVLDMRGGALHRGLPHTCEEQERQQQG
jgi:AraC family transcriptional regulator of adaptative response/methylated-DNA-[protein]-cysteine methyltransferase